MEIRCHKLSTCCGISGADIFTGSGVDRKGVSSSGAMLGAKLAGATVFFSPTNDGSVVVQPAMNNKAKAANELVLIFDKITALYRKIAGSIAEVRKFG